MKDIEDINSIKIMVDSFYDSVRADEVIGPVFSAVITGDWQPHLNKMYAFWNAALFGVQGFKGNPFAKHAPLPINKLHFKRWTALFDQTIDRHFSGEVAEKAKLRAGLMSEMFQHKLAMARDMAKVIL
nr:group III truncated hemoglobin [Mucilaginibacter sp. L294]